ncbi:hypothetical protein [Paenibacillus sp. URB8-2]|uniref:hypothetical protein n=1 Tax=Paenibacillus sp. URB8-2 TaxID=2741301 RepID=UPI0015B9193E|nr:hypothetical protein [Paenibacillus sp. URB8-2]BCG57500.1 hypothetical protein PUR_09250 [Paenibacillus sp. URB8-2]
MNINDITPGQRVLIAENHPSGYGGRTGRVLAKGTRTVLIDIGEPLLASIEPEYLEPAPDDPLPPGWEEVDV